MTNLNVPTAHDKTFPASTELDHEFLGVLLYSQKMIASFPVDKLTRTKQDLTVWLSKGHACTLRELLSLIGTLQFACAFLQRMMNLTLGVRDRATPSH